MRLGVHEARQLTTNDAYWGSGKDGKGRNQLGKTLMRVRGDLRAAEKPNYEVKSRPLN